jgi:hypothetical protein
VDDLGKRISELQQAHLKPTKTRIRTNPASRSINYRKRQPTKALRTINDILKLPAQLEQSCKRQRTVFADIAALNRRLRIESKTLSAEESSTLISLIETKEGERRNLQYHIRKKMREIEHRKAEKEPRNLETLAKRNPHKFHEYIRRIPATYELYDGSSSIAQEKLPTFTKFFREQLGAPDNPATGADDPEFDEHIPRASHMESTLALTRDISWQEIHLNLQPAHHEVKAQMCHAQCLHCTNYNQHLAAWRRGDSNMIAPEFRPRLHTSKSAVPDSSAPHDEQLKYTK